MKSWIFNTYYCQTRWHPLEAGWMASNNHWTCPRTSYKMTIASVTLGTTIRRSQVRNIAPRSQFLAPGSLPRASCLARDVTSCHNSRGCRDDISWARHEDSLITQPESPAGERRERPPTTSSSPRHDIFLISKRYFAVIICRRHGL